jgi:hypothetical protein
MALAIAVPSILAAAITTNELENGLWRQLERIIGAGIRAKIRPLA